MHYRLEFIKRIVHMSGLFSEYSKPYAFTLPPPPQKKPPNPPQHFNAWIKMS